ncbi:hypothetical protein ACTMU2_39090 [Cupriavidus basilensis]
MRFVAKSEIRGWPVIGWLCEKTGTLFIERARDADAIVSLQRHFRCGCCRGFESRRVSGRHDYQLAARTCCLSMPT